MLTRLKVSGFKNLDDVDVRFGPFTCVAGPNGVGKSNLFDAIVFLSALAGGKPLVEAAMSVRNERGRSVDVRQLFHRVGGWQAQEMTFEAEIIIPKQGIDDLGQEARASSTFLRYKLKVGYRQDEERVRAFGPLEILEEELNYFAKGKASERLRFEHKAGTWRESVLVGQRRGAAFISTEAESPDRTIRIHQDGVQGRTRFIPACSLPRTVLSATNAAESPTATLARLEMRSWRILQLEPSALREPDELTAATRLGAGGSHLAATLYRLANRGVPSDSKRETNDADPDILKARVYADVANRLAELVDDVRAVRIDRDEKRELLTVLVTGKDGTAHPARSLSDGTLRFLALAVLELDPDAVGLICLEEPENGIHAPRIPAMIRLLNDIATDANTEIGPNNPLRQVITNTHSPAVVAEVSEQSLLVAELKEEVRHGLCYRRPVFSCLPGTWRARAGGTPIVPNDRVLEILNPVRSEQRPPEAKAERRRVIDRSDLNLNLPFEGPV